MFWVTARLGAIRGTSWPVRDQPLIFGRGQGCDVPIPDRLISRQHCVLVYRDGEVRLRDLGSSNRTLLNGQPVTEAVVNPGDEIAVGNTVFVLGQTPETSPEDTREETDLATLGSPRDESPHTPRFIAGNAPIEGLSTIEDYVDLFRLFRSVSQAASMSELLSAVRQQLEERISVHSMTFFRPLGDKDFSTYHEDHDGHPMGLEPSMDLVRKAFEEQHMHQSRLDGDFSSYVALAVPMTAGQEKVGVLGLCILEKSLSADDSALLYLGALAGQMAPLFHMVEQVENLRIENERLKAGTGESSTLVGESPEIRKAHAQLREAARSGMPVLIIGETGTGKELAARLLHEQSDRASEPFVAVNCAAIPADLMESEFFGYERGAFTGALGRKIGRMEEADKGTLFLDEIGDLSLENQARILRAIEHGTFYRIGGNREIAVDVRIVAATNKDIPELARMERFRMDLYHRINGFVIELPPLRDRREDIPILAHHFIRTGRNLPSIRSIDPDAVQALMAWVWPGNVRELRNCIERACFLASGGSIHLQDLRLPSAASAAVEADSETSLADIERQHIVEVLEKTGGNITLAAKLLGVSRPTVYRKMAEYEIRGTPPS